MSQKLNALTHGLTGFIQTYLTKHLKPTGTSAASSFSTPPPTPPRPPTRPYSRKSKTTHPKRTRKLRAQMANSIASHPSASSATLVDVTTNHP